MRIPRPKEPEAPFARRRAPPPQATKLLRWSAVAGAIFVGLLAVVFVPNFIKYGSPCRSTVLTLEVAADSRILVTDTVTVLERSAFRANLTRDNVVIASLGAGLTGGTAALDFADRDGDGAVGPGDAFPLDASTNGRYLFEVFLVCDGRRVGLIEWTGALSGGASLN